MEEKIRTERVLNMRVVFVEKWKWGLCPGQAQGNAKGVRGERG